jgi:hypothetical protein
MDRANSNLIVAAEVQACEHADKDYAVVLDDRI